LVLLLLVGSYARAVFLMVVALVDSRLIWIHV